MPHPRTSHILIALFVSVSFSISRLASTGISNQPSQHRQGNLHPRTSPSTCELRGNPDLYGLGIRLGLYLQWTASVLAKAWMPSLDSLRDLLDADAIFLFAIFIATAVSSAGLVETVHDVDILILLHMFFGDVYSIFFEIAVKERNVDPISPWGSRYRAMIIGGMATYAIWFWFVGIDRLPTIPCESLAFLFAKVALHQGARIFFQILAVMNFVLWGPFGLLAVMVFPLDPYLQYIQDQTVRQTRYYRFNRDHADRDPRRLLGLFLASTTSAHSSRHAHDWITPEYNRILQANHPWVWKLKNWAGTDTNGHGQYKGRIQLDEHKRQLYLLLNTLVMVYSILAIELIIHWNHITGTYGLASTSQIIPFVIGLSNFWRVAVSLLNEVMKASSWDPSLHVFRLRGGKWKAFPISKPARRLSMPRLGSADWYTPRLRVLHALDEDYKEWDIPPSTSTTDPPHGPTSTNLSTERLGISSLSVFLLSLASDSRIPSTSDRSALLDTLLSFARSRHLTVLGLMTRFKDHHEGSERIRRELLLWPLTAQAARKLAPFRKWNDDLFVWRKGDRELYRWHLGLEEWDDGKYDPEDVVDSVKLLRSGGPVGKEADGQEEDGVEDDTWRRVWTIGHKNVDRERIASCFVELLKSEI